MPYTKLQMLSKCEVPEKWMDLRTVADFLLKAAPVSENVLPSIHNPSFCSLEPSNHFQESGLSASILSQNELDLPSLKGEGVYSDDFFSTNCDNYVFELKLVRRFKNGFGNRA